MIAQLTTNERQFAMVMLIVLAVAGLVLAVAGRDDLLGGQGLLIFLVGLGGIFGIISKYYSPEPTEARFAYYYDDPTKAGIVIAMVWAVIGMLLAIGSPGNWSIGAHLADHATKF
jgi:cytochrome c oxidase cbb3-type subunit 1